VILAISGSLRRSSLNSAALRAAARAAAPTGLVVELDDSVRSLPPFDPDREVVPPESVLRFRRTVDAADGLLLAVPEYTFGLPGAFKNALDWLVRSGSLYHKPVALLHIAPAWPRRACSGVSHACAEGPQRGCHPLPRPDRPPRSR